MKGTVFNIQRYSINDGPGIRTVVFLKGCPMNCLWCENPESIQPHPQLAFYRRKCIECGKCQQACPFGAIDLTRPDRMDWNRCTNCGQCIETCPSNALRIIGEEMTSEEVVDCVLRDRKFYERSGGGVTVSGGEPTFQYEFLLGLLSAFKKEGLHTVLETNGLLSWDKLEHLTKLVDIFYFDLKGIDPVLHKEQTGVSNDLILTNAKWLIGKFNVVFRLPLIPTLNTTPELIKRLDDFLSEINATEIHLLPYHRLGEEKLESIHTHQRPLSISEMTLIEAERWKQILQKPSRRVFIGGF